MRWKELHAAPESPITLALAKQHCRVIDSTSVAAKANASLGSGNSQVLVIAKISGTVGNSYSAKILVSGLNTSLSVVFADRLLTVRSATNGTGTPTSTANDVIAAIYANAEAAAVFDATGGSGTGTGIVAAVSPTALNSGVDSGDEDSYIQLLIDAATEILEIQTSRIFIERDFKAFLDHFPSCSEIELPLSPVTEVTSVEYYDLQTNALTPWTNFTEDLEDQDLPARIVRNFGTFYPYHAIRPNAIEITFSAGYAETEADIPRRVKSALCFLVAHWFANREPVINGTAVLSNKIPYTFETVRNSFRLITV